jgi:alkanesulfonate monooxygenase SsuD/methylene tetrahydromethanopterin reductase-like flavin-dependent oxidoreductase (luciferase family)
MFPNPPGLLRLEPLSEELRDRIWWGSASNATAIWAAERGMNLQSSTLKADETGEPFHVQQARQIRVFRKRGPTPAMHASRASRCPARSSP